MISQIKDGISQTLASAFPDWKIYADERVEQGMDTPCCFVEMGEFGTNPLPCGMMELRQAVTVVYFPERQGDFNELWGIGPQVLTLLEQLRLPDGSMVRGSRCSCAVTDSLMQMRVTYRVRLRLRETTLHMEEMDRQTQLV